MSILIDPYMFELSSEEEIRDNIVFFQKVSKLISNHNNSQRLSIALYKGVVDKISNREIQPFPISPTNIYDRELKSIIFSINKLFNNSILRYIEKLDIDQCSGEQDFYVENDNELVNDNNYYELLSILVIPCYSKDTKIDERILTGKKSIGKKIGDFFSLKCNCEVSQYNIICRFVGVDEFITDKEQVIEDIKKMKKNGDIITTENVIATIGDHHNHVQADAKKFSSLQELSARNKRVLLLLREFGMNRIIFGAFTQAGARPVGTMSIQAIEEKDTQDIVKVKFTAETNYVYETELYFPKGIGKLLQKYFKSEQMTYKEVSELVEKCSLFIT